MNIVKIYLGFIAITLLLSGCQKNDGDISTQPPTPIEEIPKISWIYPDKVLEVLGNKWVRFNHVICEDAAVADSLTRLYRLDSMFLGTKYTMATVIAHDENGSKLKNELFFWGPQPDIYGLQSDFQFPLLQVNGFYEPEVFIAKNYDITSRGSISLKREYRTRADTTGHYTIVWVRAY